MCPFSGVLRGVVSGVVIRRLKALKLTKTDDLGILQVRRRGGGGGGSSGGGGGGAAADVGDGGAAAGGGIGVDDDDDGDDGADAPRA